ncbi:HDOD domain-containing protein [Chrysiogenes arsenatis]|uniref:HDOD domain-containing protein n=1 Tax=Chrysiogenes arsenatis TaxID=309797 RepID=UPI0004160B98|nr:HDOD domain-containing protein [Chrysiogenes arsenatis]
MPDTVKNLELIDMPDMEKARSLINHIGLPHQPRVVMQALRETQKESPDFGRIVQIINSDTAMAAKILKLVNAPAWGLRQHISSISQALALLGIPRFNVLVITSALKEAVVGDDASLHTFWLHSVNVARGTEYILDHQHIFRNFSELIPEQVYLAGLFHDAAVPMIAKRYPLYREFFPFLLRERDRVPEVEFAKLGTYHHTISYILARSWGVAPMISETILSHHENGAVRVPGTMAMAKVSAALQLADYLDLIYQHKIGNITGVDTWPEEEWAETHEETLFQLDLDGAQLSDLIDDFFIFLGQQE